MRTLPGCAQQRGRPPGSSRVGYLNAVGALGKRILVPDPENALVITDLFHHFETAKYSIKSLAAQFLREGRTLLAHWLTGSQDKPIRDSYICCGPPVSLVSGRYRLQEWPTRGFLRSEEHTS